MEYSSFAEQPESERAGLSEYERALAEKQQELDEAIERGVTSGVICALSFELRQLRLVGPDAFDE